MLTISYILSFLTLQLSLYYRTSGGTTMIYLPPHIFINFEKLTTAKVSLLKPTHINANCLNKIYV